MSRAERLLRLAAGDAHALRLALRELARVGEPLSRVEADAATLREALDDPGCTGSDALRIALVARACASRMLLVVRDARASAGPGLALFWVRWLSDREEHPWHLVAAESGPRSLCGRCLVELAPDGTPAFPGVAAHETASAHTNGETGTLVLERDRAPFCGSCVRVYRGRRFQARIRGAR